MPSISASPNPVGVYSANVASRTLLDWDFRPELSGGKIFVTVDGLEKEILDTANPAPGTLSGTLLYTEIRSGKTYKFTLRRRTDLSELASTFVTTFDLRPQLVEGFSSAFLPQVRPQAIKNLSVRPGIDVVLVTFKTARPTIPLIELRDASGTKIDARFALFGGMRTEHSAFFGEDPPLALETKHTIHIVASGGGQDVELNAEFITGSRTAEIQFEQLDVWDDSDPGLRGEGEFFFEFGAGDAVTTESLGEPWPDFGWVGIDADDAEMDLNKTITIPKAPRLLWAQALAYESDFAALPTEWFARFRSVPGFATPGSEFHYEEGCQEIAVTDFIDIDHDAGSASTSFELKTENFSISFLIKGHVAVESKFGQFIGPKMHKGRPRPPSSAALTSPGDASALSPTLNVTEGAIVVLGPDNALYHRGLASMGKRVDDEGWARIELPDPGTPVAVASAPDKLDVLLLREDGAVLHTTSVKAKTGRWRNLGGDFGQLLAAVEPARSKGAEGTVALFGVAKDGSVHARDSHSEGRDWVRLGDRPPLAVTAATVPGVGAVLFAMGEDRLLRAFIKKGGRWTSVAVKKPARGDRPLQSLAAVVVDAAGGGPKSAGCEVVIGALSDDQLVQILRWPGFPSAPPASAWQDAGSVQDLLLVAGERSAPRGGTRAKSSSPRRAK